MLQMPVLTTEKLTLPASTDSFTLSSPDIFSDATAGDVYLYDLSLEFSTTTTPPNSLLKVTIIESYTQNNLASTMLMNITDEPDKNPIFIRFSPVIFTVTVDGTNPLDDDVVHLRIELISGSTSDINVTAKALWYQTERVDF